jgi:alanine-glyoxylate transaminase/serine-glyoxylate transaminase/serine-pyruvate transaminase
MYSGRAIKAFQNRKTPPGSYFASFKNWMPSKTPIVLLNIELTTCTVMQNYEAKKASYFATPSPQLIHALHTSLTQILSKPLSERFAVHKATSQKIKNAVTDLGLKQLASDPADQANGMTAIYLPENVKAPELLPNLLKKGVIFAGGLHKEIAAKYIRFGHMGVSVVSHFPSRI